MRRARIKRQRDGAYYHLYNRIIGCPGDYPFGDIERDDLVRRIRRLAEFYTIEPIDYVIMGNHFHLVAYAPGKPPSLRQAAKRYNRFYPLRRPFSRQAIGETGITLWDRARLGILSIRAIDLDVSPLIGLGHTWPYYYNEPRIARAIVPYTHFADQ